MVGKIAQPSNQSGASARGNVRYILGYELGAKDQGDRNESFYALLEESRERDDLGVGSVWSPEIGEGRRPSSVYVQGVSGLATADMEMQSLSDSNKRTKIATHHEIFSWTEAETKTLTDEQLIGAVRDVYATAYGVEVARRMQVVMSVHRDTDNAHVHVALGSIDPSTGRALFRTGIKARYDRGMREVELAKGWSRDHGLFMIARDRDGNEVVLDTPPALRARWKAEAHGFVRDDRHVRIERKHIDERDRKDWDRFVNVRIEPAMRKVMPRDEEGDRLKAILWGIPDPVKSGVIEWRKHQAYDAISMIDIHNLTVRDGARLKWVDAPDGTRKLGIQDVSTVRFREEQAETRKRFKADNAEADLHAFDVTQKEALSQEIERLEKVGPVSILSDRVREKVERIYTDIETAEAVFKRTLREDPSLISAKITESESVFSRHDLAAFIERRVSNAGDVDDLTDHVLQNDKTLVLADVGIGGEVWTTKAMLKTEKKAADLAKKAASTDVRGFDVANLEAAIVEVTRREREHTPTFVFSDEQRAAISHVGKRLSTIEGVAGSGKTTMMSVVKTLADIEGKSVFGVATAASAAEKLEVEGGFSAVSVAKLLTLEANGIKCIPRDGYLIVDEVGMVGSGEMHDLLEIADRRRCAIIVIGDERQAPSISAGNAMQILKAASKQSDTYEELTTNYRQRHDLVPLLNESARAFGNGIRDNDESEILVGYEKLAQNGSIVWCDSPEPERSARDAQIAAAVTWYLDKRLTTAESDVLLMCATNEMRRKTNEAIREHMGLGADVRVLTEHGYRDLVAGETIVFTRNHDTRRRVSDAEKAMIKEAKRAAGIPNKPYVKPTTFKKDESKTKVLNNQKAKVVGFDANYLYLETIELDGKKGRRVKEDLRNGKEIAIDHAYAITIHKSQGASVKFSALIHDIKTSPHLIHVAMTRAKREMLMFVNERHFGRDLTRLTDDTYGALKYKETTRDYGHMAQEHDIVAGDRLHVGKGLVTVERVEGHQVHARDAHGKPITIDASRGGDTWEYESPEKKGPLIAQNRRAYDAETPAGRAYEADLTYRSGMKIRELRDSARAIKLAIAEAKASLDHPRVLELRAERTKASIEIIKRWAPEDRPTWVQRYDREQAEAGQRLADARKQRSTDHVSPRREHDRDRDVERGAREIEPTPERRGGPTR